jgi:hypothetical protein
MYACVDAWRSSKARFSFVSPQNTSQLRFELQLGELFEIVAAVDNAGVDERRGTTGALHRRGLHRAHILGERALVLLARRPLFRHASNDNPAGAAFNPRSCLAVQGDRHLAALLGGLKLSE